MYLLMLDPLALLLWLAGRIGRAVGRILWAAEVATRRPRVALAREPARQGAQPRGGVWPPYGAGPPPRRQMLPAVGVRFSASEQTT